MLGTGKNHVFVCVSSNKMASGIYLNESVWSFPLVGYNIKQNVRIVELRWKKYGWINLSDAYSFYQVTASL